LPRSPLFGAEPVVVRVRYVSGEDVEDDVGDEADGCGRTYRSSFVYFFAVVVPLS
jgi:hypothetical protein